MIIAVLGTFRFPLDKVEEAWPVMCDVIEQTLREDGCIAYSYAQDIVDPGLFHVSEMWRDRAALNSHFMTRHMREWAARREALGFYGRDISTYAVGVGQKL